MTKFELKTLISKLNGFCRKALEDAAGLCVSQTNYNVELEHFLIKLLEMEDCDLPILLAHYGIKLDKVKRDLIYSMDQLKRGNARTPTLSPHISQLLEEAWLLTSLYFEGGEIRSGMLLLAILENEVLRGAVLDYLPILLRINRESLRQELRDLTNGSREAAKQPSEAPTASENSSTAPTASGPSNSSALAQFTIDLIERAKKGLIDPVYGRDFEIRQVIDILTRRRQNNPILTGEAGVGKTAIVEGFALRVAQGDVPPALQNVSVCTLDLALLQAGAGIKGEFENRLKAVMREVSSATQPIILFIDEAHTMIGAGGAAGQNDAANLLKPALARGELRTIAATTWSEYKRYFEKDSALARRFQIVKVDEPDEAGAIDMLRSITANLEKHHNVVILSEAVADAVRFSHRYITGRQLPDKAISVLDTACARVAIAYNGQPAELEDLTHRLAGLQIELDILQREARTGFDHQAKMSACRSMIDKLMHQQNQLSQRWQRELQLVIRIRELNREIQATPDSANGPVVKLSELQQELKAVQQNAPLVPVFVDSQVVASVVSGWTGIPIGKMMADQIDNVLKLEQRLDELIVGQSQAVSAISRRICTSYANLDDPNKPIGVFLLVGPSGVGKTETAISLAALLYGGERNLIRINMSEYQESYTVSNLKGSPPGYVGYGKGGVLTEAVRHNPYSVVLLDEIEKAHTDVMELFYHVFDKGQMEDSEGVTVDFRNTVIILTSNICAETIRQLSGRVDATQIAEKLRLELLNYFQAAFLGRLVVVPYLALGDEQIGSIVKQKLAKICQRFRDNHRVALSYDEALIKTIVERCTEVESGARNIDQILTNSLLPELSRRILERMAASQPFSAIHVGLNALEFTYAFRD